MPYVGRNADKLSNVEVLDTITFDGSQSYTLQKNSVNFTPSSANTLLISIDGVVQAGNFTVSGSTVDFGVAVASSSTCDFILHYGVGLITTPADGTITDAKLAASAINSQTAETSIAGGDEVLIYDTSASALRKMTRTNFVSGIGGTNTPMFLVSGGSGNQTISHASYTKVEYNQEIIDTDSAFDLTNNKFVVPSGEAGKYQLHAQFYMEDSNSNINRVIMLMKKNNTSFRYSQLRFTQDNNLNTATLSMNVLDDASAGDYYEIFLYQETSDSGSLIIENSSTSYSNNWFQGYKLL